MQAIGIAGAEDLIETQTETVFEAEAAPASLSRTVYFPQFQMFKTIENETAMVYSITGRMELVDECLRVVTRQGSYLLIWPGWYDFFTGGREITVERVSTGAVVTNFKLGDTVTFSGAEPVGYPAGLQYAIPDQCTGPYWAVGDIDSVQPVLPVKPELPVKAEKIPSLKEIAKPEKKPAYHPVKKLTKKPERKSKATSKAGKQFKNLELRLEETMLK